MNDKVQLVGKKLNGSELKVHQVRRLSEEELSKCDRLSSQFAVARGKFNLFRIIHLNFESWEAFVKPSDAATHNTAYPDKMLEADRLILNLLSSTKALIDHFTQHYVQLYRHTPYEKDFEKLLGKLSSSHWSFAFFQDFRNFVQHCGLPTGSFHGQETGGIYGT